MAISHETLFAARALLQDPKTSFTDLKQVIVKDRVLTETLITLIKSYGFPPEAWNVTSALLLLDFGAIRGVINDQLQS